MTRPFVLLYEPRHEAARLPLSLLHAASALDAPVRIVDGRLEMAPAAQVAELCQQALCLGVTTPPGGPALTDALEVTRAAKTRCARLPVLWGGPLATSRPDDCLATGLVDACVLGPGERTFAEIVAALRAGGTDTGIRGMAFLRGSEVLSTLPRAPEDLNHLPGVDYGLLDLERHFRRRGARRVEVCTSRDDLSGGEWSALLPPRVVALLRDLAHRHRAEEVVFTDQRFFADAERVMAIASGLVRAEVRLRWTANANDRDLAHALPRLDLGRLRESGASRVTLWVEGAPAPGFLERVEAVVAGGLAVRVCFIVGKPDDPEPVPREAQGLARRLLALGPRVFVELRHFEGVPEASRADLAGEARPRSGHEGGLRAKVARWSFYLSRAGQRPRRLGQRLASGLARARVRVGFYGLDFDRRAVLAVRRAKAALALKPPALVED